MPSYEEQQKKFFADIGIVPPPPHAEPPPPPNYEEQQAKFRQEAEAEQARNDQRRLEYEAQAVGLTASQLQQLHERGAIADQQSLREREESHAPGLIARLIGRKSKAKKAARGKAHAKTHAKKTATKHRHRS